jgi:hypothetical protein
MPAPIQIRLRDEEDKQLQGLSLSFGHSSTSQTAGDGTATECRRLDSSPDCTTSTPT